MAPGGVAGSSHLVSCARGCGLWKYGQTDVGRKYSVMMAGLDGSERAINLELFGSPDAQGFVWLDEFTQIHERDLQLAFADFQKCGGRVTVELRPGQGPHVRAHSRMEVER